MLARMAGAGLSSGGWCLLCKDMSSIYLPNNSTILNLIPRHIQSIAALFGGGASGSVADTATVPSRTFFAEIRLILDNHVD
jgi:hypothetical protein